MRVQIVHPTDGWILQKLAMMLIDNIDYVTGSPDKPNTTEKWDLTYYVNYYLYKPERGLHSLFYATRNSRISGGFFTHKEKGLSFEKRARQLDFCICPCTLTRDYLKNYNRKVFLAYHGIDLERFSPKIKLGFIGRIHKSGRKGEDVFAILEKLPFVELHVTNGTVPEEKLPEFYHSIDYVLIPAVVEGGPLCFQEGLACGKEIISTDVGMVHDFKHHEGIHIFDRDNPETLINICNELYNQRLKRRQIIEEYSQTCFVQRHMEIFDSLVNKKKIS
jgi:glycosyltransferase involved in cell wall biosynthesis